MIRSMAMDPLSAALHGINILLTLGLLFIYVQNYMKIKSKYTIGLMVFAAFFLVQSAMGLYFDAMMVMYSSPEAKNVATILEVVKAVGFAILLWISWE